MFRDSWEILDPAGAVRGKVTEDSGWKAMVRRTHDVAAMLMPQTFHILVGDRVVGTMAQNFNPFVQKYQVDLTGDDRGAPAPPAGRGDGDPAPGDRGAAGVTARRRPSRPSIGLSLPS